MRDASYTTPGDAIRSDTGNDSLFCPAGLCANFDSEVPIFEVSSEELFEGWKRVLESQPRTKIRALDPERGLIHAEQRSKWLRFVDTILIRIAPVEHGSSYIVLSRSELGSSDFGVNAQRLESWTQAVAQDLASR